MKCMCTGFTCPRLMAATSSGLVAGAGTDELSVSKAGTTIAAWRRHAGLVGEERRAWVMSGGAV